MKLPPYFHFLVALFFLLLTGLLSYVEFDFFTSPPEKYVSKVTKNLREEFGFAQQSLTDFKQQLLQNNKDSISFQNMVYNGKYPILVYKNDQVVYWTDYKYALNPDNLTGKFSEFVAEGRNGVFAMIKEYMRSKSGERYSLVVAIPIYQRYKIDNQYLKKFILNADIFPDDKASVSINPSEGMVVKAGDGRYLFSVILAENYAYSIFLSQKDFLLLTSLLVVFFAFVQVRINLLHYLKEDKILEGFIWMVVSSISIRLIMLFFNVPAGLTKYDLFNAKIYASSVISPSLGDLFLNVLLLCIITAYIYIYQHKLFNYRALLNLKPFYKITFIVFAFLFTFVSLHLQYIILETIYFNSQIRLDITADLDYNILKISCFFIFIMSSFTYFFVSHVVSRIAVSLNDSNKQVAINLGIASAVYLILSFISHHFNPIIFIINLLYVCVVTFLRFFRNIRSATYFTYIYLFFSALVSALLGAYSNYVFENRMDIENKSKFASRILIGNDKLGEFLLTSTIRKVQEDQIIATRMLSSLAPIDLVFQKIKKQHLDSYFDKYEVNILLFNSNGQPYNYDLSYDTIFTKYNLEKYKTEDAQIFFINDLPANAKRYLAFIDIDRRDKVIGKIILDLTSKKVAPNSVYPRLFLDKKFANYYEDNNLSYAIYKDGKLWDSFGSFGYDKSFLNYFNNQDPESEIVVNNYRHFLVKESSGKQVVVTSEIYPFKNIVSNFSFLFLLLVFFKLPIALIYEWYYRHVQIHFNFASRIQLYLNAAFFLPLLLVSILVISILNSDNKNAIKEEYIKSAENIAVNLANNLEEYEKNEASREQLLNKVTDLARLTQSEINLYGNTGKLIGASQPLIYENGLLSELINPAALTQVIDEHQSRIMLTESIGSLEYNSVYANIKNSAGEVLGILGLPFFESQKESEQQIINVLATILNVFTFTFIGLLLLSYFASHFLTEPLRMITQKLRGTTLSIHNEPLEYKSDDEIGLLVGAYNKMLVQLEESKEALSKSEKESAWREMAKQVAHEIKNPLTPMKLTLQHIRRVISENNPRIDKSLETLLMQVDILSDIATSFSSFANMPIPQNEEFEISEVLRQTVNLYDNDSNAKILMNIPEGQFFVNGDQALMGRIFTNLIINGIQAVPNGRLAEIVIFLKQSGTHNVLIEITDNGVGIGEAIRHKVFLPNFSTKFTGSGIGLALAKRGIEHAGGKIWFETEDGLGTSFFIELPLLRAIVAEKSEKKDMKQLVLQ